MSSVPYYLVAIAVLGMLMVVHEAGHYLAARAFGMRVTKFSIGIAPILFRFQPKGSPTLFQIGAIPFFAFVQIAGMNPLEEVDPEDKGSYANASLLGRIVTIFAGSLANYLTASIFFLASIMATGQPELDEKGQIITTTKVRVMDGMPAANGGMQNGDKMLEVEGTAVENWEHFRQMVSSRPSQPTTIVVDRNGERVPLMIIPQQTEQGKGRIGAEAEYRTVMVPFPQALKASLLMPPKVVGELVSSIAKLFTGKQKPELGGPAAIVKEGARAAKAGFGELMLLAGILSANLAGFNLLPFPALDGGRLIFLGYEAVSRRRPNAMIEAHVHLLGFVMLLALMVFVTWGDLKK
ncbi:MAG: M50 family metallopeptidase [Polyangiaceae bacterium]